MSAYLFIHQSIFRSVCHNFLKWRGVQISYRLIGALIFIFFFYLFVSTCYLAGAAAWQRTRGEAAASRTFISKCLSKLFSACKISACCLSVVWRQLVVEALWKLVRNTNYSTDQLIFSLFTMVSVLQNMFSYLCRLDEQGL